MRVELDFETYDLQSLKFGEIGDSDARSSIAQMGRRA